MDKLMFSLLEILVDSSVEIERFNPPTNITLASLTKIHNGLVKMGLFMM
jgi:hypothetical protein